MDEKKPLIPSPDDHDNNNTSADPPPSYVASAREHSIPLRQSAAAAVPIRKGGPMPPPMPPMPPQPLELPIIQYMRSHRVILASASPRRRAMLAQLGLGNIEVRPSTKPEDLSKAELGPHGYVAATARQKALDVYQAAIAELVEADAGAAAEAEVEAEDEGAAEDDDATEREDGGEAKSISKNKMERGKAKKQPKPIRPHPGGDPDLVIAADTVIVTRDGQVLEKPASEAAHVRMLRHLRDTRVHRVLTAVCAVAPRADASHPGYEMRTHVEETRVWFAREGDGLPDDVLERYARTREGADKAGGYAVQGVGGMLLVEKVEGAVDNVVGLPVRRCLQLCEKVVFRQDEESDEESDGEDEGSGGW